MALGPIQSFIDAGLGATFVSFLHTAGAILYLGGIIAFGAWLQQVRGGVVDRRLLAAGMAGTYVAIAMNMLGGIARTYQTGHPSLQDMAYSPWVQIMFVKHVFLVFGMLVAVWLFERIAPRLIRHSREMAQDGKRPDAAALETPRRAIVLVVASILIAAALGAASSSAELDTRAADLDGDGAGSDGGAGMGNGGEAAGNATAHYSFTGSLTSTAATPRFAAGTFDVLPGAAILTASLTTSSPSPLVLRLADPDGFVREGLDQTVPEPVAGTWRYEVTSDAAIDAAWELTIDVGDGRDNLRSGSITLQPGLFFEVNTDMVTNQTLWWDWSVAEASDVDFNLHTHDADGNVEYPVEFTAAAGAGNHTATYDAGYSLMWENPGATPVTVHWVAWGEYEFHSYSP